MEHTIKDALATCKSDELARYIADARYETIKVVSSLPDRLARASERRTALKLSEAAAALEMGAKALQAAVRAGNVMDVTRGTGSVNVQRRFLLVDLIDFLETERVRECPFRIGPAAPALTQALMIARERLDQFPLGTGQIARIPKPSTSCGATVICCQHVRCPPTAP